MKSSERNMVPEEEKGYTFEETREGILLRTTLDTPPGSQKSAKFFSPSCVGIVTDKAIILCG